MSLTINSNTLGKHNQAMWFAQDAVVARIHGDEIEALYNFNNALELEIEVLESLEDNQRHIETYGIILRSAANLAKSCYKYEKAIQLINNNKNTLFSDEITEELEELRNDLQILIEEKNTFSLSNTILIIEECKAIRFLLAHALNDISDLVLFNDIDLASNYLNKTPIPKIIIYGQSNKSVNSKKLDRFIEIMHRYHIREKGFAILLTDDLGNYNKHIKTIQESVTKIIDKPFNPRDLKNEIFTTVFFNEKNSSSKFTIKDFSTDGIYQVKFSILKRIFDILVSSLLIILLIPMFAVIALSIKLESKGPAFYRSLRIGFGFTPFFLYKFRTKFHKVSTKEKRNKASTSKIENKFENPETTIVGNFLRNTSLDELPQLFNVLIGDMSLVGNKPLTEHEATSTTSNEIAERFLAPAGITGLWHSKKRKSIYITWEERMMLDVEYSKKNSFLYDLWILIKTPLFLLKSDSAGNFSKDKKN